MRPWLLAFAAVSAAFAGCSQAPASEDPVVPEATAAVAGVVVDPALFPIADATVRLDPGGLSAATDPEGRFAFEGLRPGAYTVQAGKAGYLDASLPAEAGAAAVRLVLDPDPRQAAYAESVAADGFVELSLNVASARSGSDSTPVDIGERVPGLVQVEVVWEPTQELTTTLDLTALPRTGEAVVESIGHAKGASPLLLVLDAEAIAKGRLGPDVGLSLSVFAGEDPLAAGRGAGVAANQPYRIVVHLFYGFLPPEGWRFTADGEPPAPA